MKTLATCSSAYLVELSCPQYDQQKVEDGVLIPINSKNVRPASSFAEASSIVCQHINKVGLSSSSWSGGRIFDVVGNCVAHVSYNGKVWEGGNLGAAKRKEINL